MGEVALTVDPMADFQAKLKERVRNDIRDLLPEDAVAALVAKAVEEEFFKPRTIKEDWGRTREAPSWFIEEVVEAAKPVISKAVNHYITEHPADVEKVLKDFLNANVLTVATTTALTGMLSSMIMTLQENLNRR